LIAGGAALKRMTRGFGPEIIEHDFGRPRVALRPAIEVATR
jgi:hypothetical protein